MVKKGDFSVRKKQKKKWLAFLILLSLPIIINQLIFYLAKTKNKYLSRKSNYFSWKHGKVYYTVKGKGTPLLLLHGLGTGASSFEFHKNIDVLSQHHKIYALDFLGFGRSDKPAMTYTGFLYVQLIIEFIRQVIGQKTSIVASSHSTEYAVAAASMVPNLIDSLILISPTGIVQNHELPKSHDKLMKNIYTLPVVGDTLYNILSSRKSIKSFLQSQIYYRKSAVSDYIVEQYYISAHMSGSTSKFAPASFLTNYLNVSIDKLYRILNHKICLIWGKEDEINPLENLDSFLSIHPNVQVEIFEECKLLPHDEHSDLFNNITLKFLHC